MADNTLMATQAGQSLPTWSATIPLVSVADAIGASVCEKLRDTFQTPIAVWRRDAAGWNLLAADVGAPRELPADAHASSGVGEPAATSLGPDAGWLLTLSLTDPLRRRLLAAAVIHTGDIELAIRCARVCGQQLGQSWRMKRQQDETTAYVGQITEDFEELTFLRSLAEYLDLSDISQDPWQSARIVLPLLMGLIKAEALLLFPPEAERPSESSPVAATICAGTRPAADEDLVRLIATHAKAARQRPFVANYMSSDACRGVRNLVLLPVAKQNCLLGWLVAVNRWLPRQATAARTGEDEFGTVEASLLSSAATMLATHARNVQLFHEREALLIAVVRAMVCAIDAKDPYTCGHSERVALVAQRLASELGLPVVDGERLYLTGLLHDVGKIGVSDAVLRKPGRLTEAEFAEIKKHPDDGWAILNGLEQLSYVLPGVLHHHESFDGRGYPDGLAGERIPRDARILAVADAYDAMRSDRPYRSGMPAERVDQILREGAGTQWDPAVIDAFFKARTSIGDISTEHEPRARTIRTAPA